MLSRLRAGISFGTLGCGTLYLLLSVRPSYGQEAPGSRGHADRRTGPDTTP